MQQVATLALEDPLVALLRTAGSPSMTVWIEFDARKADPILRELRRRLAEVRLAPAQHLTLR